MSVRRRAIILLIGALALLGLNLKSACSGDSAILKGNHPPEATTLVPRGDADPNRRLSMEIRFAVRNKAQLDQLLAEQQNPASPNFHHWLATGEYDRRFGPGATEVDAVSAWLKSEGFAVEAASDGGLKFSGTVAQAEHAFATRLTRFGDGSTYANIADPSIPSRFADVISAILGLDNMTRAVPASR